MIILRYAVAECTGGALSVMSQVRIGTKAELMLARDTAGARLGVCVQVQPRDSSPKKKKHGDLFLFFLLLLSAGLKATITSSPDNSNNNSSRQFNGNCARLRGPLCADEGN